MKYNLTLLIMCPKQVPKNMKLPVLVWLGDGRKLQMNDRNVSTGLVLEYHQFFDFENQSLSQFKLQSLEKIF